MSYQFVSIVFMIMAAISLIIQYKTLKALQKDKTKPINFNDCVAITLDKPEEKPWLKLQ